MATHAPALGDVAFDDAAERRDRMHSRTETWISDLVDAVDDARASEQFERWLAVQSRFHDYSHRNTQLIALQCPEATRVAGYRTWQREFDRQVKEGESAIWIWAPIITEQCPACGNAPSYHADSDCAYDETPPEEWDEGVVAFKPVPVFDVSQTEGEPLPELETAATGDADALFPVVREAGAALGVDVRIVAPSAWPYGDAAGICEHDAGDPIVRVRRADRAAMTGTLIHEYAHALLHDNRVPDDEHAKREVEAEAVAYVVGRHLGLDVSGSAFYLAAWADDERETLQERLGRISQASERVIEVVDRGD